MPFFERCRARYGQRFTVRLVGSPPFVMLADPDEVKQVFTAPAEVLHPGSGARILEPATPAPAIEPVISDKHSTQRLLDPVACNPCSRKSAVVGAWWPRRASATEDRDGPPDR